MSLIKKLFKKNNIAIITCYDASFASMLEYTEVDALLVGDSLGTIIKGGNNTHNVSIEEISYHVNATRMGAPKKPIIADMPLNSFNNKKLALNNALKLKQSGADLVKIEGGEEICSTVKFLSQHNVIVCGHIGYMPQIDKKNKKKLNAAKLLKEAISLEEAGVKMLVLSMTNKTIDQIITKNLNIPTISFRSSASCKGQVEILYDLLGISIEISKDLKNKNFKKLDFNSIQKFIKIVHKT
jgi:3-methyl-2-oxobutanoate hydroxymethyltransferase